VQKVENNEKQVKKGPKKYNCLLVS
jgi:hypothetical protein